MHDTFTSEAVPPANEEEVLAEAFPAIDASEEEVARMAQVSPDARLLAAAPLPPAIDLDELEEEVSRTRVIVVRGQGIPVDRVISIGGSILFHTLIIGGFVLALYFAVKLGVKAGGGGGMMAKGSGGGSEGGYMIAAEAPRSIETRSVADVLPEAAPLALPVAPVMPSAADSTRVARELVANEQPWLPDDAMIGVAADRVGSLRVPPPPRRIAPPAVSSTPGVIVAPPSSPAKNSTVLASAGSTTAAPSRGRGNAGRGRGGEDDFGDEMIIPLSKGDGGGTGGGSGSGMGRGDSGANNPEPQILEWADIELPSSASLNPPKRPAQFRVTVRADATVANIELLQSCGQPLLDEIWREVLRKNKYRPAYRAGKPYEASKDIEMGSRK